MSLCPSLADAVPVTTAMVARGAFPRGDPWMRLRDTLGAVFADQQFAALFPSHGQPAEAPRRLAGRSGDAAVTRRLLALALVLDGHKRKDAARLAGMDRQALRDWVHRCDADGVAGLASRQGGGVAPRLTAEQEAEVAGRVQAGPDLARDKVVRWRCADIQARIADLFGVSLHERTVGKSDEALASSMLHRLRFSHVSTRPPHPKADVAAQVSFRAGSAPL